MVTHSIAIEAAHILADYCEERFRGEIARKCDECIFKLGETKPKCVMPLFLGICDADTQALVKVAVHEKYDYLAGFKNERD